jgi:hypothetical protein
MREEGEHEGASPSETVRRMPEWLRELIDFIRLLFAWVTRGHYRPLNTAREPEGEARRRFIVVEIDGLAHEYLLQAIARGRVPNIQRLIADGHRLQRWRCGLPSSTPSSQAGIMYGNNWNIPAFRWYEKDTGQAPHCKSPAFAERIKQRVSEGRPGILLGGSSYTNLFDGDARLALFTLSAMGRHRFTEQLRGLGWALLFALIPWRIIRIVVLVVWELLRDVARTFAVWAKSGFRKRLTLVKPVLQVMTNVVFGEFQTFGVLLDVYRGMPAIYANYYGYDEVAHNEGAVSSEALRALRRIDSYIGEIERTRQAYRPDMDLYIISDHGMSPSIPFARIDPKRQLGPFISQYVRSSVVYDDPRHTGPQPPKGEPPEQLRWLLDELDGIEERLSPRARRLAHALRDRLLRRLPGDPDSPYDLARGGDVVVRISGPLVHIYFNVTPQRMEISEIALLYPELLDALTDHPGIGLVLGLEHGRPAVVQNRGTALLDPGLLPHGLPDARQTTADLRRLLSFPHCGDLVLIGAWNTLGRVVTFEEHQATHGGAGGPQDYPLFLSPPSVPVDVSGVTNSSQLYEHFMSTYHSASNLTQDRERLPGPVAGENMDEYDAKIVKNFTDAEGRIKQFPAQQKKFDVLLRYVLKDFEREKRYTEKQVNEILARYNEDTSRLRRGLIDSRLMARDSGGAAYWRIDVEETP